MFRLRLIHSEVQIIFSGWKVLNNSVTDFSPSTIKRPVKSRSFLEINFLNSLAFVFDNVDVDIAMSKVAPIFDIFLKFFNFVSYEFWNSKPKN